MSLTPEQKAAVSSWVAAGDNLSAVQKKLTEQFKVSLTYRDVRFLVDDLNLELKDPAPKVDASDVSKTPPPPAAKAPAPATKPAGPAGIAGRVVRTRVSAVHVDETLRYQLGVSFETRTPVPLKAGPAHLAHRSINGAPELTASPARPGSEPINQW